MQLHCVLKVDGNVRDSAERGDSAPYRDEPEEPFPSSHQDIRSPSKVALRGERNKWDL